MLRSHCLLASGYDERGKTLFIWQGMTMYLTPEGVDSTLAFIANHSGLGSAVIFDYFYNETLRGMKMKTTRRITRMIGELASKYLFDKLCSFESETFQHRLVRQLRYIRLRLPS